MALTCDYCGDVTDRDRISLAFGHNQEIALKGATATKWFYYCEGDCADTVKAMLDNMGLYALHGEEAGLVWALTEQKRAPVLGVKPAGEPPREDPPAPDHPTLPSESDHFPTGEEFRKRTEAGLPLSEVVKHGSPRSSLRRANLVTVQEVAERREVEILGLPYIGKGTVAAIVDAMRGLGLAFRDGPSPKALGQAIRDQREAAGIDRHELAERIADALGVEKLNEEGYRTDEWDEIRSQISGAETGKPPQPKYFEAIASQLQTTPAALMSEAQEQT